MSDPVQIFLVYGNDWQGLYFNSRLVKEGHRIELDDVLVPLMHRCVGYYRTAECNQSWLENVGRLPENLNDVELIDV